MKISSSQTRTPSSSSRWTTKTSKPQRLATVHPTFDRNKLAVDKAEHQPERDSKKRSPSNAHRPFIAPVCESDNQQPKTVRRSSTDSLLNIKTRRPKKNIRNYFLFKSIAIVTSFAIVIGAFIWLFATHMPTRDKSANAPNNSIDTKPNESPETPASTKTSPRPRSSDSVPPTPAISTIRLPLLVDRLGETPQPKNEIKAVQEMEDVKVAQVEEQKAFDEANAPAPAEQDAKPAAEDEPTEADKTAALLARVTKLLGGNPNDNADRKPLPIEQPGPEPIARIEFKKPLEIDRLQTLNASQLRSMLQENTNSVDLFKNKHEFDKTKNFLSQQVKELRKQKPKNAPPARTLLAAVAASLLKPDFTERGLGQEPFEPLIGHLFERDDLQGLPLALGAECRVDKEGAAAIASVSGTLGRLISEASAGPNRLVLRNSSNVALRTKMIKVKQELALSMLQGFASASHPQYLTTTDQILQVQHPQDRLELINNLKVADNETAARLLAKRAKYDLSAKVRIAATNALAEHPREDYRAELLAGLKYPWHVVAQHSAEALARLDDKAAIPELIEMLDLPHPSALIETETDEYVQPTLVAINHMRNCLLCHAPSQSSTDIATGIVPSWDQPTPTQYYVRSNPDFVSVRADITYLKQDFSVVQPVQNHGPWPDEQRFDYVVQQAPVKKSKVARAKNRLTKTKNLNREAIIFALQQLSNQSPKDNSSESWRAIIQQQDALLAQAEQR